jgi:hypothetical protein
MTLAIGDHHFVLELIDDVWQLRAERPEDSADVDNVLAFLRGVGMVLHLGDGAAFKLASIVAA